MASEPAVFESVQAYQKLFTTSTISALYKRSRPSYPDSVYSTIDAFICEKLTPPFDLAVDVGCGPGQSTRGLAASFKRAIGVDVSESQIKEANEDEDMPANVNFRVGTAFSLPIDNQEASLVCCGLAAHWFDPIDKFYSEADRVLRPGGCLALFGYGIIEIDNRQHGQTVRDILLQQLYFHAGMKAMRSNKSEEVYDLYRSFVLPYPDQKREDSLEIKIEWTLDDLLAYFKSFSFYQNFLRICSEEEDPLRIAEQKILELFDGDNRCDILLNVRFPVFILLGRKPLQ